MHNVCKALVKLVDSSTIYTHSPSLVALFATIYTSSVRVFSETFTTIKTGLFSLFKPSLYPFSTPLITSTKLFKYYFYS